MTRITVILPYFGPFPSYFQLFLDSCKRNSPIRWLLITDNMQEYCYPENFDIVKMSFKDLKAYVQDKFDFPISLERPQKLCDFKPAYGYIFKEFIQEFDFWGHCDADIIFGELARFFPAHMEDYDKIFDLGHLTLYRNTEEINTQFRSEHDGGPLYKKVYMTNDACIFDEGYNNSINNIFLNNGYKLFTANVSADIYTKSSDFRLTYLKEDKHSYFIEKKSDSLFAFEDGKLSRYSKVGNKLVKKEYAYIHLQKRKMKNNLSNGEAGSFLIIPNSFENKDVTIDEQNWRHIKKKHFNLHYFKHRAKNLKTKIGRRLGK